MDQAVELIPLVCLKCSTPILAQPDEVAWVCAQCGSGQGLDGENGLQLLEVRYSAGIPSNASGRPFWVVEGRIDLERDTYSGNAEPEGQRFWSQPRRFFVPAYECPLESMLELGSRLLLNPPALEPGPPTAFEPVTLTPQDVQAMVEFIVMAVEAERKDKLKQLYIQTNLSTPGLWILPGTT